MVKKKFKGVDMSLVEVEVPRESGDAGVRLVLYPLSAFRAAAKAQVRVYEAIRAQGTQQAVLPDMQTRAELYEVLGYHDYERKLDELFGKST